MGLPMFQEADDTIATDAAAKLDRAAAQSRSAIRRQPTVRPGRGHHSERRGNNAERERMSRPRFDGTNADLHIAQLETELERLRAIRVRNRMRMERNTPGLRDAMELVRQSRETFRDDDDDDDDENDVSTRAPSPVRRLPRPAMESNLRFEVGVQRSGSVSPRRLMLMSPPSSSGSGRNVPDGPLAEGEPALMPNPHLLPTPYVTDQRREDGDFPTPPPEAWEVSHPPLRRVGHFSPRPHVDGLGDRRRSLSPDAEEETWVNMLTTMDDSRSNSAATSFASSIGRSRSSQNTSTSFGEIGQADESCDLDLPSGITEDDVREIREQHRHMRSTEPDGPVMTGEQGLRQHESRRTRRVEWGMFQNILERMQRREDVPDEWWAAVGLTPDVVRNA